MKSKKSINKRGSYIVETSICLPIFMIAVIVMTSIILLFACIENSNYIIANELRNASIEAKLSKTASFKPLYICSEIKRADSHVTDIYISDYGYLVERNGIDKLIPLRLQMKMRIRNPLDLVSKANYDVALVTRAYVGKERDNTRMSKEDFENNNSEPVFIFPHSGKKYHKKDCSYVMAGCYATPLSVSLRMKYSGCRICKSKNIPLGSIVYIFPRAGESYHLPNCDSVNRKYIEVEKKIAKKRGYSPCSKCGG